MEYKFRAFIPQLNIMIYGVDVYANGTIGMTTDKLILPADYYIDWDSSCIMQTNPDEYSMDYHVMNVLQGEEYIWFEEGQYKLMQLTGLKDKNGVEVYQGDIAKQPIEEYNGRFFEVVGYGIYEIKFKDDIYMNVGEGEGEWLCLEEFVGCEVIGSIFTTPELLNAK